jgi:hypothetical protein
MRVNIENCANNGSPESKAWLCEELARNLKELRDRAQAGDMDALREFFELFTFNDSGPLDWRRIKRQIDIGKAVERACESLPVGYDVIIQLERNAGSVSLCLPDTDADISIHHDDGFGETIHAAIDQAIEESKKGREQWLIVPEGA